MHIHNLSRQTTLATNAHHAKGFRARLMGLMFKKSLPEGGGLLLKPETSIHTFFMRFPIDVLYLNREWCILRADAQMRPNRIGPIFTRGCHAILELPPGTIAATQTEVGDQLHIKENTDFLD